MTEPEPQKWELLDTLRTERNLRYADLAEKSGVSPTHVRDAISGRRTPTIEVIKKLAKALDVDPVVLLPPARSTRTLDELYMRMVAIDKLSDRLEQKLNRLIDAIPEGDVA